nr:Copper-translocating P-type ATPase [Methylocystis sp. SC2]
MYRAKSASSTCCSARAAAVWLSLGKGLEFALERTVTVMVITCPHCARSGGAARRGEHQAHCPERPAHS